jgi:MYXO-CTERM domain-containing protein
LGETGSLSNAIFVGGWYTNTNLFSMTSGTSGVYVSPPVPEPAGLAFVALSLVAITRRRRRRE